MARQDDLDDVLAERALAKLRQLALLLARQAAREALDQASSLTLPRFDPPSPTAKSFVLGTATCS